MTTEIKEKFEGTWKLHRHENYENYLNAAGISYVQKKLVRYAKPKLKLSVEGDVITIEVHAVVVHTRTEIKLDEEYTNTYLGTKVKAFPTYSDGKMCVKFTSLEKDGKVHMFTRELIDGEMVHTLTVDGVTCKHYYRRIEEEEK